MSFFGWALVFVGLGLLAIIGAGLFGLRLWRQLKALGRDFQHATSFASESLAPSPLASRVSPVSAPSDLQTEGTRGIRHDPSIGRRRRPA